MVVIWGSFSGICLLHQLVLEKIAMGSECREFFVRFYTAHPYLFLEMEALDLPVHKGCIQKTIYRSYDRKAHLSKLLDWHNMVYQFVCMLAFLHSLWKHLNLLVYSHRRE